MNTSGSGSSGSSLPPSSAGPLAANIAAVSLKLPPYWQQTHRAQVEAQFQTCNVTSQQTMYNYVVGSLSPEYATEVRDSQHS